MLGNKELVKPLPKGQNIKTMLRSAIITDSAARSLGFKKNDNNRYIYIEYKPGAEYYNTPYRNRKTNNSLIHKTDIVKWKTTE